MSVELLAALQQHAIATSMATSLEPLPPSIFARDPATDSTPLERVPDLLEGERAFRARNLVAQAQSDYAKAVQRGDKAAAMLERSDARVRLAHLERDAERGRAEALERQLRQLQPQIRDRLVSPLFSTKRQASHELRPPWLWCSWALVVAGIVVCVL